MLSQTATIWASATGAALVVGGAAAAIYWAHPAFLWPTPVPATIGARAPLLPASAIPAGRISAGSPPAASAAATRARSSPDAAGAPPASARPSFDVISVEPTGETVVAGRAPPNAKVELKDSGKVLAEATANAEGQFVIIPPTLPPGEHSLSLAAGAGPAAQASNAVSVAVAAASPAPTAKASLPAPSSPAPMSSIAVPVTAASGPAGPVAVQSIEASAGGRLVAKGEAAPNAVVRLYLSGAYVGDAKTKADGRWSLTIEHGLTPGAYEVRADQINPADAKVEARAEAPFTYPATAADAQAAPIGPPNTPAAAADVVVDTVQTHHVDSGNTLWGISQKFYGDGSRYEIIFAANSRQIRDPHWIYPGQVLVVPKAAPEP
jgi:nucleoid-associated protein YgaU